MDDIHARTPVNKLAAVVLSKGVSFDPAKQVMRADSELPHGWIKPSKAMCSNPSFEDLTGRHFGRFVVLGLSAEVKGRWVVRCNCGKYSMRTKKAILNPTNTQDRCDHCRHLSYLKRAEIFRRTGKNVDINEF